MPAGELEKADIQEKGSGDLHSECPKKEEKEEEAGSSKVATGVPALVKSDSIEQTLICQICQVLLYIPHHANKHFTIYLYL